jgi:hypothetical protein
VLPISWYYMYSIIEKKEISKVLGSSANQTGFFRNDAVKHAHVETGDLESASSHAKNHCSREERDSTMRSIRILIVSD